MKYKLTFCAFFIALHFGMWAQTQPKKNKDTISQNAITAPEDDFLKDSIVDGLDLRQRKIDIDKDSLLLINLEDHLEARDYDNRWWNELYSNTLFDTIYKSVSDLTFEEVDYPELPSDTLKARLAKLNAKTPFNIEYNPSLESVIKSYLKYRREPLQRLMALSHYYFPLFEEALDKHDIPLEVKYLAIIESALKPRAKSRVGATGLWQFMFGTGKMYGLDVSSYVDERSDPNKSTEAATKFLAKLYEIFGDWDLVLAAYNSGPGNVTKAIRRSGGYENYWNIRPYLPRETAGYLPAFLATMYIFEYAEEHGFQKVRPEINFVETDTIHVKHMITFDQISELLKIPVEQLQFLNPSYKLDIIPYIKGEDYTLRLPRDLAGVFVANEDKIYAYAQHEFDQREKPLPKLFEAESKVTYRVRPGDYLGKIARIYGVRVSQLKQWNGLRSNDINIGQRLTVYPRKPVATAEPKAKTPTKTSTSSTGKRTYLVQQGDSLWSISQKFPGISIQNIKDWNNISGTNLKVGMKLIVSK